MACCTCLSQYFRTVIALCLVVTTFILDIIGYAAPYWYYEEDGTKTMFEGIWKTCSEEFNITTCVNFVDIDTPAWFQANQAVQTVGMLLLFAALVLLIVKAVCLRGNHTLKLIIIFFLGFGAAFILIGAVIYGVRSPDRVTDNLNFGFILVVIAAGLAIIASIFVCIKP